VSTAFGTVQRGAAYVAWEAPPEEARPVPLVLVHGGGGQGTDWTTTVDGRPGWRDALVAAGFAVYVLDRPGHGRSPGHPDVLGAPGAPGGYEATLAVFADPARAATQTQWPWDRTPEGSEVAQVVASSGAVLADLAAANELDAAALTGLLDTIGPAVLVTHSLGSAAGWLAANRRPHLVRAIVAVEPVGPPFVSVPGLGSLTWGLTAAPLRTEPPAERPEELQRPDAPSISGFPGLPVALVTGQASPFAAGGLAVAEFLGAAGARVDHLALGDLGITGNGHALMREANSDDTVVPVLDWITTHS
jgi:pimeloyl-ACP methyl ester carboxylesterase